MMAVPSAVPEIMRPYRLGAFEEGALELAGNSQRQSATFTAVTCSACGRRRHRERMSGSHENPRREKRMRPRQQPAKISDNAFRVVAVEQRRAEARTEQARPGHASPATPGQYRQLNRIRARAKGAAGCESSLPSRMTASRLAVLEPQHGLAPKRGLKRRRRWARWYTGRRGGQLLDQVETEAREAG